MVGAMVSECVIVRICMPEQEHPDTKTPRAFLLLATKLVQAQFPQHPRVTESRLTDITWGSWGAYSKLGERTKDGIGWTLSFEREVQGWCNEIYADHWKATAHRPGWQLVVQRTMSDWPSATPRVWSEERTTEP